MDGSGQAPILPRVPRETLEWLTDGEIPQVALEARRALLGEPDSPESRALDDRRNAYAPIAAILEAQRADGSWADPARDYQKYGGSLWQVLFLGELGADGSDERVRRGAEYAFSRQAADGSWSYSDARAAASIPCLTANVARSLARLGYERDPRVARAIEYCVGLTGQLGAIDCRYAQDSHLNGYCHMLTPKLLLLLAAVPRDLWPAGADQLRQGCVEALRDKEVFRCLPEEAGEFLSAAARVPAADRRALRERFLAEHAPLHYREKPGWLRFGFPLSYNSDVLEALVALKAAGETARPEYEAALEAVRKAADPSMRWSMRNSLNGKMLADVEEKGRPSRWLTLRALSVLSHFEAEAS